ncbi:MAG: serine/threonine-protein phosphatase [Lachnospiraceae bacterium]|nr:serine/threonine-protein phosphatase [Lachnospiraceae bacterium]
MIHGACFSDKGTREINEDCAFIKEENDRLAAVVADGLGGQGGGNIASQIAVKHLCDFLPSDGQDELHNRFEKANEAILNNQRPGIKMMSTAVALYVDNNYALWAHMGDSRLYHFYNGKLLMQTYDHSVSQMAVYRGDITQDKIRFHEDRNRILRALGGDEEAREEQNCIVLDPGFHAFLLCTDGFWEYVLEKEMEDALSDAPTPEEWIVKMCNLLMKKEASEHDNFTVAAIFYAGEDR